MELREAAVDAIIDGVGNEEIVIVALQEAMQFYAEALVMRGDS